MIATVEQIEKDPAGYLRRVLEGETVTVFREGHAVAEIRPLNAAAGLRPLGLAKGEFLVPDDFDDPLPEEILDSFKGR
ncbi:MAG TPA: type II toxin-antitoxin system Phd/YefM family antitoxin [Thermoanaerobaculia bacterium]|jgi:antitoxin (DNA-binding transcriptional repressor) of toxin-antitoxin stability system